MHDNPDVQRNGQGQQRPETDNNATGPSGFGQAPSIALPKGGGAIQGIGEKFAVNPATGTACNTRPGAAAPRSRPWSRAP